jgi:DNA-binding MarR family transcriptional regulator
VAAKAVGGQVDTRGPDPWAGTDLDVFKSTFASLHREIRQVLDSEDMLLTDLRALRCVGERPCRATELATQLELTPAAATQLIDRLERRGFVVRSSDPVDRRATVVRRTPAGHRGYEHAARAVRALIVEIAGSMSPAGLGSLRRGSDELARVLAARRRE